MYTILDYWEQLNCADKPEKQCKEDNKQLKSSAFLNTLNWFS